MIERTCVFYDGRRRLRCTECGALVNQCVCTDFDDAAQNRVTSPEGQILTAIWQELWNLKPADHLAEQIISDFGHALLKIVVNNHDRSVADSDIRRELIRASAKLLRLTATGTPEYAYPSTDRE